MSRLTHSRTSRRAVLGLLGGGIGAILITACAPAAPPTPVPPTATTANQAVAPSAPTATTAPPTAAPAPATPTAAPAAQAVAATPAAAELEIWEQEVSIKAATEAAKAFEQKYPNVKLKWVPIPGAAVPTKLLATIAAGSGSPDVTFISYDAMVKFTTRDGTGMVDLRDALRHDNRSLDEYVKFAMDLVTTKTGKVLGLPVDLGAGGTFYRRDVFEEAKLPTDPGKVFDMIGTWEGLITAGTQIVSAGKYLLINASDIFDVVRQQGKQAYFDDADKPIVNSTVFVAAAELAVKARQLKLDLRPADGTYGAEGAAAMKAGKVGAYFSAAWWDIIIDAQAPETKGKWGVTPLPGGSSANFGGSYYCLPAEKKQREQAWTFISFMTSSKEGLIPYLSKIKFLPGWKPIYSEPYFTRPDPNYAGQVWLKQFTDNAEKIPFIALNVNDPIATEVVQHAIADILDKGVKVKDRLDQANKEIEQRIRA